MVDFLNYHLLTDELLFEMIPYMNYLYIRNENYLYNRGESTKQFYFILRGNISIREKYKREKQEEKKNNNENLSINNQKLNENKRPLSNYEKNKPTNNNDENKNKYNSFRKKNHPKDDEENSNTIDNSNGKPISPKQQAKKINFNNNKKEFSKYFTFIFTIFLFILIFIKNRHSNNKNIKEKCSETNKV